MSLLGKVLKRANRGSEELRFKALAEPSVDALVRVEAECDWSDAWRFAAELPLAPASEGQPGPG